MNGIKSTGKGKSGKSYGAKRVKRTSKEEEKKRGKFQKKL